MHSLSELYERRFLHKDVMKRDFLWFKEPARPFTPKTLITPYRSKLLDKRSIYQPRQEWAIPSTIEELVADADAELDAELDEETQFDTRNTKISPLNAFEPLHVDTNFTPTFFKSPSLPNPRFSSPISSWSTISKE